MDRRDEHPRHVEALPFAGVEVVEGVSPQQAPALADRAPGAADVTRRGHALEVDGQRHRDLAEAPARAERVVGARA